MRLCQFCEVGEEDRVEASGEVALDATDNFSAREAFLFASLA
jgi:hypothetical protein